MSLHFCRQVWNNYCLSQRFSYVQGMSYSFCVIKSLKLTYMGAIERLFLRLSKVIIALYMKHIHIVLIQRGEREEVSAGGYLRIRKPELVLHTLQIPQVHVSLSQFSCRTLKLKPMWSSTQTELSSFLQQCMLVWSSHLLTTIPSSGAL